MLERIATSIGVDYKRSASNLGQDLIFGNPESDPGNKAYILSPEGATLVQNGILIKEAAYSDHLKPFLHRGTAGDVTRRWIGNKAGTMAIDTAIKIPDYSHYGDGNTGFDQFTALRHFKKLGFNTVVPLFASKDRLITLWQDGEYISPKLEKQFLKTFTDFMDEKKFEIDGWKRDWVIDWGVTNYYVRDLSSTDPRDWFLIIDPIAKRG